ncbi:MAG: hydroxyethylthiazole kinase [Symbiobacterium sp.]|uniref:hydroxyethylthiazole kinase n=1 Tax=Symbiobacterium sp. TaxID=1971213 RepID=UPI0034648D54
MTALPERVRERRPLVHAMTNYVTMDWVARGLLAAGARPVMARDGSEAPLVAAAADALVLNLGTWGPDLQQAMLEAGQAAARGGIPVVLDPVGAGGIATRTRAALDLLERVKVTAVRGNAGEVLALAGEQGLVRGIDGPQEAQGLRLERAARAVARRFGCVVAVTGPVDLVTDGQRTLAVRAGHPLMAQIPGAGCLAAALVAAALAAGDGSAPVEAAAEALLWAGWAGEQAAADARGPGSFAAAYLDRLAGVELLPAGRVAPPLSERLSLYVLVSGTTPAEVVEAVLQAGCRMIQFREKHLPLAAQVEAARWVREACRRYGALFLVNDRVDLALAVGADGVHLGQDDMPVAAARRILGPEAIIGATCETAGEARAAEAAGADYIGAGPVYATPSKADAGAPYGPDVVRRVSEATCLPVVGIGGIGIGGAAPVIAAGAAGVAVISAVAGAADPGAAARAILEEVESAKRGGWT